MKPILLLIYILFPVLIYSQSVNSSAFKKVETTKIPKPIAPAKLVIKDLQFNDANGNNNQAIDANEEGQITFNLSNEGKGEAYETEIITDLKIQLPGISISNVKKIELIKPGETKKITMNISADRTIENNEINLSIQALEGNGFDADPVSLKFNAFKFKNPQLVVADYKFSNKEGEGKIKLGETVNLQFMIQNKGQGIAKDIKML